MLVLRCHQFCRVSLCLFFLFKLNKPCVFVCFHRIADIKMLDTFL